MYLNLQALGSQYQSAFIDGKIRGVRVMVFNIIFNDISAISWQSVLLVEETGENH
jgi:hypothetical protein